MISPASSDSSRPQPKSADTDPVQRCCHVVNEIEQKTMAAWEEALKAIYEYLLTCEIKKRIGDKKRKLEDVGI